LEYELPERMLRLTTTWVIGSRQPLHRPMRSSSGLSSRPQAAQKATLKRDDAEAWQMRADAFRTARSWGMHRPHDIESRSFKMPAGA